MSTTNEASKKNAFDMDHSPIFIAINSGSGADIDGINTRILDGFRAAGREVTLHEIPTGVNPKESCEAIAKRASEQGGIMVAAGGDGTVNMIAGLCYAHQVPLGVIPLGTFNYVARALNVPLELEDAVATITTGRIRHISAGFVQEHLFLNNASFGLYPTLIRKREQASARFGRKRIVAALSALHSLFSKQKLYSIQFNSDEASGSHRTSMVFVGNNTLQLENFGLEVSECTAKDRLAVIILRPLKRFEMGRLMWRGIVKNLKFESKLVQFCADSFEVNTNHRQVDMVVDGEIVHCHMPLKFRVEPQAIQVIVPQMEQAA